MSIDAVTCGVCGKRVYPDDDHAVIEVSHKRHEDLDAHDEYYLHPGCQRAVFGRWNPP